MYRFVVVVGVVLGSCVLATSSCGRVGFDTAASDGAIAGHGGSAHDAMSSMMDDAIGSGSADSDAPMAACGDGTCNGGEICATCKMDCGVRTAVCGNGQCDPGEDGTTCMADCGPSPWPFTGSEGETINDLNTARVGGALCGGSGSGSAGSALSLDASLVAPAREWAWELAYQNTASNGNACNGRTLLQRLAATGAGAVETTQGSGMLPADAVNQWLTGSACPQVTSGGYTKYGIAVAHVADADNDTVYVLLLK